MAAADALREAMGAALEPDDRVPYERGTLSARARLSEREFDRAWAAQMDYREAVDVGVAVGTV